MAEHLASIFGTEKDRVNCPFYFKIGACRHGDRCSRLHNRPTISPTLLLSNMYQRPDMATPGTEQSNQMDPREVQEHFEDFYEDLFEELSRYGEIESLNVCDNIADHMVGNVYVNFREEEQAAAALQALTGRFYAGRPIIADFSPVTDFREATCRQYEENTCNRGGYCNFMHLRKISRELRRKLFGDKRRSRSRSFSPRRDFDRRDDRQGGRYGGGGGRSFERGGRGGFGREGRGGRGYDRRFDDRDGRNFGRDFFGGRGGRRERSPNPDWRRDRPRERDRDRSPPAREGSEERRAKIEQWNREREERDRQQQPQQHEPSPPPYYGGGGGGGGGDNNYQRSYPNNY
eukprot:TRINITY_DN2827_c0_g1_i1.p1 TRINITY_DN2827_c0_g1~~TRINITY_DN2827_c0_g1_i1.p1  ORF type:complete len:346 (+),score=37.68 TRINITY_DN2827_c0_g1_i1:80-1117(+)